MITWETERGKARRVELFVGDRFDVGLRRMATLDEHDGRWCIADEHGEETVIDDVEGDAMVFLDRLFSLSAGDDCVNPNEPILDYAYGTKRLSVWGVAR